MAFVPHHPAPLELLRRLANGETTVDSVAAEFGFQNHQTKPIDGATVDLGRASRCGFGEVIYGQGKSAELIAEIIQAQLDAGQNAMVTRVDPTTASQVRRVFEFAHHNPHARTLRVSGHTVSAATSIDDPALTNQRTHVAVATAGSTDLPVAEEAIETLEWMGIRHQRFDDIGVAGPARLLGCVDDLRLACAVVVVAGMEGALPSVVGGHLDTPVFAVPTSVGYGANLFGMTPLMGMLSCCAPNVAVVNVDAGFKGGYLAGLVASQANPRNSTDATAAAVEAGTKGQVADAADKAATTQETTV